MARNFSVDFAGRIRNFTLKKKDALLPLFETIVNSLQAIEDADIDNSDGLIEIRLNRLPVLDESMPRGEITGFTVTDNGTKYIYTILIYDDNGTDRSKITVHE